MTSSEKVVYTSRVRIERQRGPLRLAYLPAEKEPVVFGVHSEVAEHYRVPPEAFPPRATTLDYVVAAAAGWLTGTFGGALEARQIDASDGKLISQAVGEIELDGTVLVIRRISVHYKLQASQETQETVERVHSIHAEHCPVARSIRDAIEIRTSFELITPWCPGGSRIIPRSRGATLLQVILPGRLVEVAMARLEELKLSHRLFMKAYRYRSVDWSPGARFSRPLSEARLALISTAGLHLPEQPAFDPAIKGGDASFRELANNVEVQELRIAHRSSVFDQAGALKDRNLVFPLDRFRELVARREAGSLNYRHFSFMGSIAAPGRLISETAPQVAAKLRDDQVDAAFLVPVWPMCNQSVGLIASVIERSGIPTVCLSLLREVTEKVRPPRSLFVPFPIGYPLGAPDQPELQHSIMRAALDLLTAPGSLPLLRSHERES